MEGCHYVIVREDRHQEFLNFIRDYFIPDEPCERSLGLPGNEELEQMFLMEVKHTFKLTLVGGSSPAITSSNEFRNR